MFNIIHKQAGFTLLEVMVAMSIVAIALTALLSLVTQSVVIANEIKFSTVSALLAQKKMAELEREGINDITSFYGTFEAPFEAFTWSLEVEDAYIDTDYDLADKLKKTELTIRWGEETPLVYKLVSHFYLSS